MNKPNIIDGVALMADAIRKEQEEKQKQENPPQPLNVSELTAQFATGATPPTAIDNTGAKQETKNEETNNEDTKNESEDKNNGIN